MTESRPLQLLIEISNVFFESIGIDEGIERMLKVISQGLDYQVGLFWKRNFSEDTLECRHTYIESETYKEFTLELQRLNFRKGEGLPGKIWNSKHHLRVDDLKTENYPVLQEHSYANLRAAFGIPVINDDKVIGVLEFLSAEPRAALDNNLLVALEAVGQQIGSFLRRKETEDSLRENEEKYRLVIDASLDAVITIDDQDKIIEWNLQAESIFGWRRSEAIGQMLADLIIPIQYREAHMKGLRKFLSTGEGPLLNRRIEISALRKTGAEFPVELTITPVRMRNKVLFSAFVRDIKDRLELRRERGTLLQRLRTAVVEAEMANKSKDDFIAMVSHELRAPLTSILGWSHLLSRGTLPEETTEKAIAAIERNAKAQMTLIEDLLDISRIVAGKIKLEKKTIFLPDVVNTAVETIKPIAEEKKIAVNVSITPDINTITGDPQRLHQVITNLLNNSLKFTQDNGFIIVQIYRERDKAVICVQDNGKGIEPKFLPFLFDRYKQGRNSEKGQGLGIGLAIVKHVVDLHEGTIHASSEGIGKGCTIIVKIPLVVSKG